MFRCIYAAIDKSKWENTNGKDMSCTSSVIADNDRIKARDDERNFKDVPPEAFPNTRCTSSSTSGQETEAREGSLSGGTANDTDAMVGNNSEGDDLQEQPLKRESILRRERQRARKSEDLEAKRRVKAGLKPYAVEVKPDGMIDTGCQGHEKWQQFVRSFTPKLLTMSEPDIKKQQGDLKRLNDFMFSKFEFLENKITLESFKHMILLWMRQAKSRWKLTMA